MIARSPRVLMWRAGAVVLALSLSERSVAAAQSPAPALPPSAANANANTGEPPGYRAAIDSAIAEHEAGHFAESRALFARAHALFPNARTFRGLGMAEFELRNYESCVEDLQQALASPVKPLEGELRTETEQLLARARAFVGRFQLQLQPANASVTVNGVALANSASPLMLTVGDHQLLVSADGYLSEERTLSVTGGEDTTLPFTLLPQPSAPIAATAPSAPSAESEKKSSVLASPWLWVAVGAVVVGAAVGIGVAASSGGGTHTADANGGSAGIVLRGP